MISVVIPTYNEADSLSLTLRQARERDRGGLVEQWIVADGGSSDATCALAEAEGATVVHCPTRGRAPQLNQGAAAATAPWLYFLHADTLPPQDFSSWIQAAVGEGYEAGCFRLSFDRRHPFLEACCWFTRFDIDLVRFGDQSLYLTRACFAAAGGFDERLALLEDQEIVSRLRRHTRFRVLPASVVTSGRKYWQYGVYRTQVSFALILTLYHLGVAPHRLAELYRRCFPR